MAKKKQVAIYLTKEQDEWLTAQADKLSIAKTLIAQGLIEKAMKKKAAK